MMRSLAGACARGLGAQGPCSRLLKLRSSLTPVNFEWVRLMASDKYPKHVVLNLPALSPTMETGNLISWAVKEGDKVGEGDVLAEIETDKAAMGFEVVDGGYVAKRLIEAGTKAIPLGTPICVLVDNPEDVDAFKDFIPDAPAEVPSGKEEEKSSQPAAPPQASTAEQHAAVASPQESDPMVISKALIPHYYLTSTINTEQLNIIVKTSDPSLSRLAVIVKAAALALRKVPDVNSCWKDACIRRYNQVNIKVMNYDKQIGHVVNALDKSLKEIESELHHHAGANSNNNTTFTIRYCPNSSACAAIIDPTQAAVLCIGQDHSIAVPSDGGSVRMTPAVQATLSCDHRVIDGATGAGWLKEFKRILECPALMSL